MKVLYEPGTSRDGRPVATAISNADGSPIDIGHENDPYGGMQPAVPGMKAMGVVRRW